MKKIAVALFLSFFCFASLFCQDADSRLAFLLRNFQYQKALEYIDTQEPSKELLMQKAFCYKALGNYHMSIDILQPLALEYPDDVQIKAELALNYQSVALLQNSVDVYEDLIRMDSTNVYFKIQKADVLYQLGKYNQALTIYQHMLQQNGLMNMLKRSAQCYEKMNMPDSAMSYYKRAWEANVKDAFSAANLINLCLRNKREVEAQSYSDTYIESDSTDKQINVLNALCYYTLDLYEEAIARFAKCYQKGDSSLVVTRSLGIAYYSLNESDSAYRYLDKAYVLDTTNTNVLYPLAVTSNDISRHTQAAEYFKTLLDRTIPPHMVLYLYYRGLAIAYEKSELHQEATDTYIQALAYATENQKLYLYYSVAQLYELFLRNDVEAYNYYQLYLAGLNTYLEQLKAREEPDLVEIKNGEAKIKSLSDYIQRLKVRLEKGNNQ